MGLMVATHFVGNRHVTLPVADLLLMYPPLELEAALAQLSGDSGSAFFWDSRTWMPSHFGHGLIYAPRRFKYISLGPGTRDTRWYSEDELRVLALTFARR
jgi:hypothetical protein